MGNLYFSKDNINFYSNEDDTCTDLIDITIVHDDFSEENKSAITNGSYIFLDNFLGELNFTTIVDDITVIGRVFANKELVPIEKLKDYLIWREKEFVEKYEGFRHDTENDNYAMLNAELKNGNALVAVINTDILEWDSKASHPWILKIEIFFDGSQNNGMPDNDTYILLDEIEDQILEELKDLDGYLNIGRQTADNVREIYFACKDFRKPSKVLFRIEQRYLNRNKISYTIYKDKYWQSFDRFRNVNTV